MNILNDKTNELLKRREIKFKIDSESNPGYEGAKKVVTEKLKVPHENIAIKFVKNNFGTKEFTIEAFIYHSIKDKELIEPKPKAKKGAQAAAGGQ